MSRHATTTGDRAGRKGARGVRRSALAALLSVAIVVGVGPVGGLFAIPAAAGHVGWGIPTLVASGDGSYGSRVAVDGHGNAIVVWRQYDGTRTNIRAARLVLGVGWERPMFVETSIDGFQWPGAEIAVDAAGNTVVAWTQVRWAPESGMFQNSSVWTSQYSVGGGWGAPERRDSGTRERNSLAAGGGSSLGMSSAGEGVLAWVEGDGGGPSKGEQIWAAPFSVTAGWGAALPGPKGTAVDDVVVDERGNAVVAWCGLGQGHGCAGRLAGRFAPGTGWDSGRAIDNTNDAHWDSRIALARSGEAFIVYPDWNEVESGIWAERFIPGSGWDAAVRISDAGTGISDVPNDSGGSIVTYMWTPAIVGDGSGNFIVAWNQEQRSTQDGQIVGTSTSVWTNRFVAGVGWGVPTSVSVVQSESWRIAADRYGNAFLTWIEPGLRTRVLASHFTPDMGWGEATPLGPDVLSPTEPDWYAFSIDVAMDPMGNAVAVWSQPDGIWANRFVGDATLAFVGDMGDALADTRKTLDATTANLAALETRFAILLVIQSAFIGSTVVLLVLYLNLRRRVPGRGKALIEGTEPPKPPPEPQSGRSNKQSLETVADPSHRKRAGPSIRWSDARGSLRLTAKERILLHLLDFARYAEASEVPQDLTLGGIAEEAGVDLRHFAQYTRPLVRDGLVRQRMARVKGGLQRRKVYVLADGGRNAALGVRDRIRSAIVRVADDGGFREATVAETVTASRGSLSILDVVRDSIAKGAVTLRDRNRRYADDNPRPADDGHTS